MSAKPAPLPGWKNLPIGCHVQEPMSARNNHTGSWRSSRPLWDHTKCVKCGVCDLFCPEGCIKPNAEGYYEANLDYCKGCGICQLECVTRCISMKQEEE
jgi:pyruvate ferredoxin oxidoreductase delta subunit